MKQRSSSQPTVRPSPTPRTFRLILIPEMVPAAIAAFCCKKYLCVGFSQGNPDQREIHVRGKSRTIVSSIRFCPDSELVLLILAEMRVRKEDLEELEKLYYGPKVKKQRFEDIPSKRPVRLAAMYRPIRFRGRNQHQQVGQCRAYVANSNSMSGKYENRLTYSRRCSMNLDSS